MYLRIVMLLLVIFIALIFKYYIFQLQYFKQPLLEFFNIDNNNIKYINNNKIQNSIDDFSNTKKIITYYSALLNNTVSNTYKLTTDSEDYSTAIQNLISQNTIDSQNVEDINSVYEISLNLVKSQTNNQGQTITNLNNQITELTNKYNNDLKIIQDGNTENQNVIETQHKIIKIDGFTTIIEGNEACKLDGSTMDQLRVSSEIKTKCTPPPTTPPPTLPPPPPTPILHDKLTQYYTFSSQKTIIDNNTTKVTCYNEVSKQNDLSIEFPYLKDKVTLNTTSSISKVTGINSALQFKGNNWAIITFKYPSMTYTDDGISFMGWYYFKANSGGAIRIIGLASSSILIYLSIDSNAGFGLNIFVSSYNNTIKNNWDAQYKYVYSKFVNQWTHVAITYKGDVLSFYQNGTFIIKFTVAISKPNVDIFRLKSIGDFQPLQTFLSVDDTLLLNEFYFFNKTITGDEIKTYYDKTNPDINVPCKGSYIPNDTNNTKNIAGPNNVCPASQPACIGFIEGRSWGQCQITDENYDTKALYQCNKDYNNASKGSAYTCPSFQPYCALQYQKCFPESDRGIV